MSIVSILKSLWQLFQGNYSSQWKLSIYNNKFSMPFMPGPENLVIAWNWVKNNNRLVWFSVESLNRQFDHPLKSRCFKWILNLGNVGLNSIQPLLAPPQRSLVVFEQFCLPSIWLLGSDFHYFTHNLYLIYGP